MEKFYHPKHCRKWLVRGMRTQHTPHPPGCLITKDDMPPGCLITKDDLKLKKYVLN